MLAELRIERQNLEQAIITLERLIAGRGRRRVGSPSSLDDSGETSRKAAREQE